MTWHVLGFPLHFILHPRLCTARPVRSSLGHTFFLPSNGTQAFAWPRYLRRYSTSAASRRIWYRKERFRAFWDVGASFSKLDWWCLLPFHRPVQSRWCSLEFVFSECMVLFACLGGLRLGVVTCVLSVLRNSSLECGRVVLTYHHFLYSRIRYFCCCWRHSDATPIGGLVLCIGVYLLRFLSTQPIWFIQ